MKIPPCIFCGKELENIAKDENINQPIGGTAFNSHGHYGSSFDPMDPSVRLEFNFCDECLEARKQFILHVTRSPQKMSEPAIYEAWNRFKHG